MKAKKSIPKIDKTLIKSPNHFPVVGIGASAGGLDAFKKLLKAIPDDSGMAYVLVQHLDPSHESMLVELLQKVTTIPVLEIADDIKVQPNHIYIIPSNKMMIANDGVLELSPRPPKNKNERNLPIDLFFTSLAEVHQSHAIGVVLSGTASDGTMGLKAIKDHGGITFAQDEESAQYEGMPHSAMEAGVVDFILPPEKIPQKLLEITRITNGHAVDEENMPQQDEDVFKQILSLLRIRKGTDFTYYKQSTIRRRILRRMAINKTEEPVAYLKYLRDKKPEQDLLYQDLLIPVTEFFRDTKIFDNLCKSVFPLIVKNKKEGEPIRVWVAGCSTGEEAYSIAICLKELLGDRFSPDGYQRVQIFATDISEPAIIKARTGIYSKRNIKGLSEEHLKEYFTKNNGDYQAKKSIRDICVFAQHNFLKDPAFSKMDFISCRNVLIYMEPYLQKKALTTFHYSLNPNGFLLLGKSETTSGVPEHFGICQLKGTAKTDKLFIRKDIAGRFVPTASLRSEKSFADISVNSKNEIIRTDFQKTADDIMLSKYTPAGVVVNEAMDIVHFRGSTGFFLEPSPGKASLNLLKMAKEGLAFELRNILHKAKKENTTFIKENIPIQVNGVQHNIAIEAIPLPNIIEPHYLVLFHNQLLNTGNQIATVNKKTTTASKYTNAAKDLRIQQLEKELAQSREDMRSITEDQEAANEELQSANEELLSSSEELQSLNEEMETSKEELQSTNEELTVVNQEMIGLNEQVTDARDYAEAIISNLHEPLLVLDKHLRIKSANSSFYKTFQVNEKDTTGKLIFDLGNRQWNIPDLRELLLNILPHKSMFENFEVTHNFPNIGERIVLLNAREIVNETGGEKLILLAIADITEQVTARKKIEESEQQFNTLANNIQNLAWMANEDGYIYWYNNSWYEYTGTTPEEMKGWGWKSVHNPEQLPAVLEQWQHSINTGEAFEMVFPLRGADNIYRSFLTRVMAMKDEKGKVLRWIGTNTDISEEKRIETELTEAKIFAEQAKGKAEAAKNKAETAMQAKQQFLSNMSHEIRTPLNSILGFTNVLMKTELGEQQKDFVQAIKTSSNSLLILINDILDLAKVDAGKMTFVKQPFEIRQSLTSILHVFDLKFKEKNLELVNEHDSKIPSILLGDPVRLNQIILNLMSNAVKFTNKGKIILSVNLQSEDEENVSIEFAVTDTGIGIAAEKINSIFNLFEQAEINTSTSYGGTGLGLAIVKQLVETQGGSINVTSQLGQGSTFTFILPFGKTNLKAAEEIETLKRDIKVESLRVLVAEDVALNQLLIKMILSDFGFEHEVVNNGKIALEKLQTNNYDLILMDLQMPEMNGFEATEYIRKTMKSNIPIIALTADVTTVDVAKCKEFGMDDYISKPINEKILYNKIVELVIKP